MTSNATSSASSIYSPHFVTYVTASVVLVVFILALFIFCLALEICRRKKSQRRLQHILRSGKRSKDNLYDKSPVLYSAFEDDDGSIGGYAPNFGYHNSSYVQDRQEEGSRDHVEERSGGQQEDGPGEQQVVPPAVVPPAVVPPAVVPPAVVPPALRPLPQEPEYDFLQDDGYLRPDHSSDRLVSYIPIQEDSSTLPPLTCITNSPVLEHTVIASSSSELHNPQPLLLSLQNCTVDPGISSLSGVPNYERIPGKSSNFILDEANNLEELSDEENPVYATVPELGGLGVHLPHGTIPVNGTIQVSATNIEPNKLYTDNEPFASCRGESAGTVHYPTDDITINIYDNNVCSHGTSRSADKVSLSSDDCDNESDDGTFLTIEDVVHSYERIPARITPAEGAQPDSGPSGNVVMREGDSYGAVGVQMESEESDLEEHVYEALPENGPFASSEPGDKIPDLESEEPNIYENCSFLKEYNSSHNSPYMNVKADSHSPYLSMDGTLKKSQAETVRKSSLNDDYLPMEGQGQGHLDLAASNDIYSYAHLPVQTGQDLNLVRLALKDNELYSTAYEEDRSQSSDDHWVEEEIPEDDQNSLADEEMYEVINAGVDGETDHSRTVEQHGETDYSGTVEQQESQPPESPDCAETDVPRARSASLNNIVDLPDYYNVSDAATDTAIHWGSLYDLSGNQSVQSPSTPAPRTLSRTFTSQASLHDDSAIYAAWATTDLVFDIESEA